MNKKIVLLITAIIIFLGISVIAQPAVLQEGNPLPVFIAILKVELDYAEVAPVSRIKYLQKAGSHEPFSRLLASHGWQFVDQLGAGLFYARGGDQLFVMKRMLTSYYSIYELEKPLQ